MWYNIFMWSGVVVWALIALFVILLILEVISNWWDDHKKRFWVFQVYEYYKIKQEVKKMLGEPMKSISHRVDWLEKQFFKKNHSNYRKKHILGNKIREALKPLIVYSKLKEK